MKTAKVKTTLSAISLILGFIGGWWFASETSIQAVVALLIILWANNISMINK